MVMNDGGDGAYAYTAQNVRTEAIDQAKKYYKQDPIAVIGLANRLPGNSNNPSQLWDFLERGGVAGNDPPESRFSLKGHYDKSLKPHTIRTPGAMFLESIDPAEFDAQFFNINRTDAIAMDPQQRQLLEVVYEGFENAGLTLEQMHGSLFGCFVGSYAVDYQDMQFRDPEDRATGITVGAGRAILSNRISHFFNLKGASMTIDTACSGSLVSVDVACRYLQTRQINGAVVAGANLYLSPDQNQDMGAMRVTSSATGKCHTFDAKADGYCKAEAVNVVILKRLDDALRDGDPIRAIIRGTSTNSDGWTPGIASPAAEAQAIAIRAAYEAAGISDFNGTGYLECHGTGTLAGDPIEVSAAASVFGPTRSAEKPLVIGSIKSNIGHSEPAAGINGLIKAVLAVEKGIIPGNPTFIDPNPKIDFKDLKVRATRTAIPWPDMPSRIASINSFGYGGSNAHAVIQDAESFAAGSAKNHISSFAVNEDDFFADEEETSTRPQILVFSANDEQSLKSYTQVLKKHLMNPSVNISLSDLTHTLSEHRSRLFNRGFLVTKSASIDESSIVYGKKGTDVPRIGFVFTGQGAQWSQMGKSLVELFPSATKLLQRLDRALQTLPNPPKWSLLNELVENRSPEHLRLPEFSQPLVTALQLVIVEVFGNWGINAQKVVGHSSGEIAAAYAAGYLTPEEAIKVAFFRGQAAKDLQDDAQESVGMLAVGLGADKVHAYILDLAGEVQIACYNSPSSITLSGKTSELEKVKIRLQADGHFARLLQVNLAYHSKFMFKIGEHYEEMLRSSISPVAGGKSTSMVSSVTGREMDQFADAAYWKSNMVSPVRFDQACHELLLAQDSIDILIEIGPSGALAGPVGQIIKDISGSTTQYFAAAKRGPDSALPMFNIAGQLFIAGGSVNFSRVNNAGDEATSPPATIIDLPNYAWNHATKYWHESDASKDWRFRPFIHHDLLGSKILGAPWHTPTYKKSLDLKDVPWLKDHKMGSDILFPASGYISMAIEGLHQCRQMTSQDEVDGPLAADQRRYRLRNIKFDKALVLEENEDAKIFLTLSAHPGTKDSWYDFKVSSSRDGVRSDHCLGLIRLENVPIEIAVGSDLAPLQYPSKGPSWYKAQTNIGYGFGPEFQKVLEVESVSGHRKSRALVSLKEPPSAWSPQSLYPMHPACIDGCFQTVTPSLWAGDRSSINAVLVPAGIDNLVINPQKTRPDIGISVATSEYTGRGRQEEHKNFFSSCSVYDPDTGALLLELTGLRYHKLDTGIEGHAAHTYNSSVWNPDLTFLSPELLPSLKYDGSSAINQIIDLAAHKKPTLKVMEINSSDDTSTLWFQGGDRSLRAAYDQYSFASSDPKAMIAVQTEFEFQRNTSFSLLEITKPDFVASQSDIDLVIVKRASFSKDDLLIIAKNVRSLLSDGGRVLFVEQSSGSESDSDDSGIVVVNKAPPLDLKSLSASLQATGLSGILQIPCDSVKSAFLAVAEPQISDAANATRSLSVVHLSEGTHIPPAISKALQTSGWQVTSHTHNSTDLPPNSTVLVLDELFSPILATISEKQWLTLKHLIAQRSKILWLTSGSQLDVTTPDNALIHGLFRTIRAEDRSLHITTLDIESLSIPASSAAVQNVLASLLAPLPKTGLESEFVERRGVIYVNRILPDVAVNQLKSDEINGANPVVQSLHDIDGVAMLRAQRLGTLDALEYSQTTEKEVAIKDNNVEVELFAAGLNFKDVAVTMGIVPENEYLLGLEGAGVVRRVGKGARDYRVGDRVAVLRNGTFANRIQVPIERTHHIPDTLSFEDAATIPLVYLTSVYSLFNTANLKEGQSVLIHSAAGGIGIACIQLAQFVGAEIYVTVGTDEKRKFLSETFKIPTERIFSSRTTQFASEILAATEGRGIDVIINSLTGELLDESWRICADGGTMVEIGKKDIVDRNHLSMEPFDRNCSFRAVDFSHKQVTDPMIHKLLKQTFNLLRGGHIGPIHPVKIFPFDDIPAAFAYMRSGRHIGKIVVTSGINAKVKVPIRPARRQLTLRGDVSYLIVGGLKGLCGSLAVHLAQHGARHIISMSRSGCSDERSQAIVRNCAALGCQIQEAKADVSNVSDVQRAFKEAAVPIGGVLQGAMVLRDKPFEVMTVEEYHTTISNKVQGTWNLHKAAIEHNLHLDFFTLLSSISGVVGQKGQANYAAANAFLDAFARYRQRLNLPANSVDLGVIEDVGYVAEQGGMAQHFDRRQWTYINESVLRKILSYSIFQQTSPANAATSAQLITGIPVPQPNDSELLRDARFAGLFIGDDSSSGAGKGGNDGAKDIQALLLLHRSGAEPAVVLASAVEVVNKQFVKTLRLESPMEPAKSLATYGLDSLSAVEFRNWVRAELGAELTLLDITNASSLFALCEKIIAKIAL
ncbi:Acyl transferase hydrolase [Venustampulla echinocandica]|uniref:Acyl transferase hydrolase n=1 Tax=Venustampulla echinocandica TaxID=2656787 RepID=A0A370U374_9HELO|nr:Acyl transferase hydrolase [Venustampulla echinocandica]RDL42230.1 Acyl transferase hydrolase [Venustampulla echinocandica]